MMMMIRLLRSNAEANTSVLKAIGIVSDESDVHEQPSEFSVRFQSTALGIPVRSLDVAITSICARGIIEQAIGLATRVCVCKIGVQYFVGNEQRGVAQVEKISVVEGRDAHYGNTDGNRTSRKLAVAMVGHAAR